MRAIAVVALFIAIPCGLYAIVPDDYVSVSWLAMACAYFVLSALWRSVTCRWMAVLTIALTLFHVAIFDLGRLNSIYGIVSLMVLGGALMAASLMYVRRSQM